MSNKDFVQEPKKQLPVIGKYDVVIAGGGMAGVAAGIAAARNSVKVCLIERYCALGGLATLGNVTIWLPLCDGNGNQVIAGLGEELLKLSVAELNQDYAEARFKRIPSCWQTNGCLDERLNTRYSVDFNPANYMLALEKLVIEEGIDLLYDTRLCNILRSDREISHIIVENKSGRNAIACKTIIDATGDADICFLAGEKTISVDSNVPAGWFYTFNNGTLKLHQLSNPFDQYAERNNAEGPFFRGDDGVDVTGHILETRKMIRKQLANFKTKSLDGDPQIIMPATMACFRMTRRLESNFMIGEKHKHKWFEDTIGFTGDWRKPGPVYAIPFSALTGVKNQNLLTAGRSISVDNTAWDNLRAIPPCVVTGEAAGTAAALAVHHSNGNIHALKHKTLQAQLKKQNVLLSPELVIKKEK